MAQATGGQSFYDALVEIKPAGGVWIDISGWGSSIAIDGGDRTTGEGYTFDGDVAIIGIAKRAPRTVTVRCLYTESASDPYERALDAYRNHTALQVRWSPKGGDTNESRYTTSANDSYVVNCPPPVGEANGGEPTMFEFSVFTSDVTKDSETT